MLEYHVHDAGALHGGVFEEGVDVVGVEWADDEFMEIVADELVELGLQGEVDEDGGEGEDDPRVMLHAVFDGGGVA